MQILKRLTDTAVLWVRTGKNAYNELTFSSGVDISVRWEDRQEIFTSYEGKELASRAILHVNQDVIPDSFIHLGSVSALSAAQIANPKLVETAYAVKAFRKVKSLTGRYTLRKVYLFGG